MTIALNDENIYRSKRIVYKIKMKGQIMIGKGISGKQIKISLFVFM